MNNPDLEESIELYLENQYPNFSLSEYEYVWTQSKNQLSELISELSKKQKNKPINRPKPLQLTPCKTCKSKML